MSETRPASIPLNSSQEYLPPWTRSLLKIQYAFDDKIILDELRLYYAREQTTFRDTAHILADGERDLAIYDAEILGLRNALRIVEEEREKLSIYLQRCVSQPAPIRRLPLEILCQVFVFACGPNTLGTRDKSLMDDIAGPSALELSRVCVGWRDAAHATPGIWCHLDIDFTPLTMPSAADTLTMCLERSRDLPLSITLRGSNSGLVWKDMFCSLIQECHRWQNFKYDLFPGSQKDYVELDLILASIPSTALPRLEAVQLRAPLPPIPGIQNAPKLRTLILDTITATSFIFQGRFSLPWSQITHVSLNNLSMSRVNEFLLLDLCHGLVSLSMEDVCLDDGLYHQPPPAQAIILHDLLSLYISQEEDAGLVTSLHSFSSRFQLPSLTSFRMIAHSSRDEKDNKDLSSALCLFLDSVRCGESLTNMSLCGVADVSPVLRCVPNLTELILVESPNQSPTFSSRLIDSLTIPNRAIVSALTVPRLRELDVTVRDPTFMINSFADMITSRWFPDDSEDTSSLCVSLSNLKLRLQRGLEENFVSSTGYEVLQELEGIKLEVNYFD